MADRISQIKSQLDQLSQLLIAELESQRKEIQVLKDRIEELEAPCVSAPVKEPVMEQPVEPVREVESPKEEYETIFTVTDLNEVKPPKVETVSDIFAERNTIADFAQNRTRPWMVDIPGSKVEMIQSALSLNDRLTFIRELFEGDTEQFNIILDRINETSSFDEVVSDMRDAYPEWDENSPIVYRFYMEVRRKFRD